MHALFHWCVQVRWSPDERPLVKGNWQSAQYTSRSVWMGLLSPRKLDLAVLRGGGVWKVPELGKCSVVMGAPAWIHRYTSCHHNCTDHSAGIGTPCCWQRPLTTLALQWGGPYASLFKSKRWGGRCQQQGVPIPTEWSMQSWWQLVYLCIQAGAPITTDHFLSSGTFHTPPPRSTDRSSFLGFL